MEPTPDTEWVSVADAAEAAGVSTSTIRYWYRHGSIPTQRSDGAGGRYLVPLDAVMARANRLGEEDELDDAELDMDAVYWSAECEKARKEATGLREQLVEATSRVAALEERVRELEAELDSLEIIEDDEELVDELDEEEVDFEPAPFVADVPGPAQGYRGPLRPQDPRGELLLDDEAPAERLALPVAAMESVPSIELDGPDEFVAGSGARSTDPEPAFVVDANVFEDDVLPTPDKKRRK